jgi:hypothetical protein
MNLFSDFEKTIERGLRQWTERVFGPAQSDDLVLLHRGILEQIETRVQVLPRGRRVFPFNRVLVKLMSDDADRRSLMQAAFAQDDRLGSDIRQALDAAQVEYDGKLVVEVASGDPEGDRPFEVFCELSQVERPAAPQRVEALAPARLIVIKGKAREAEYTLTRPRLLIGRMDELTDADDRVIRRNDIVFEDGADEANSTVSRRHAQIRYDAEAREYRVADDGSEYGTRVFRDGRGIEVPAGNRRGERLRPGDEIYLGRACLRFEQ